MRWQQYSPQPLSGAMGGAPPSTAPWISLQMQLRKWQLKSICHWTGWHCCGARIGYLKVVMGKEMHCPTDRRESSYNSAAIRDRGAFFYEFGGGDGAEMGGWLSNSGILGHCQSHFPISSSARFLPARERVVPKLSSWLWVTEEGRPVPSLSQGGHSSELLQ